MEICNNMNISFVFPTSLWIKMGIYEEKRLLREMITNTVVLKIHIQ